MNQNDIFHSLKPLVRSQKNIVYNGKKYPIDFDSLKKNSNYFYQNRKYYKNIDDIDLQVEQINITNDVFQTFIACCQNQSFQLDDINVLPLHQLSIRYEVPELIQLTKQYISKNNKNLVIQTILYKLQLQDDFEQYDDEIINSKDTSEEEELISSQILEFINLNNDQLLLLPIQILYKILNSNKFSFKEMDETDQNKIVDFMFKCLDKYKQEASILFIILDLEKNRIDILKRLLNQYSNVFDFSMINSKFLAQTTSNLLSELHKFKAECSVQINEMNKSLENQNKKLKMQEELIETIQKESKEQLQKAIKESNKVIIAFIQQQNNKQMNELKQQQNLFQSQQINIQNEQNLLKNKQDEIISLQNQCQLEIKEQKSKIKEQSDLFLQQLESILSNKELIKSNYEKVTNNINDVQTKLENSLEEKISEQNKKNEEIIQMVNQLKDQITQKQKSFNNESNLNKKKENESVLSMNSKPSMNKIEKSFLSSSSDDENILPKFSHNYNIPLSSNKKSNNLSSLDILNDDNDNEYDNEPSSARSFIGESKFNNNSSYLYGQNAMYSKNRNKYSTNQDENHILNYPQSNFIFESDDPIISRKNAYKSSSKQDFSEKSKYSKEKKFDDPQPFKKIDPNMKYSSIYMSKNQRNHKKHSKNQE